MLQLYLTYAIKINPGDKVPILLGRDAVFLGMWFPAFQDSTVVSSSRTEISNRELHVFCFSSLSIVLKLYFGNKSLTFKSLY